ncbi:hypothetical protein PQE75_gp038 [Bacillus phage vB_BcoS-136]|uniref:Uncharacterized protein n=1 Tax=Bacillus phage vB_BcoS-136 TaxID=2419619 RepID=A0A3G3BVK5_9CAUD|nr:hypothetical protein PQE75_gp038 [Bacillus phage vB_BcoS-136]AYP68170.1 hypothetical protein vBBcoS136_00038 [Bacillus phage vB_BcoS-136]
MNNKNKNLSVGTIREVFSYVADGVLFKTTANKNQFLRAVEYVKTLESGTKINTLESILSASGFYVEVETRSIYTFTI